MKSRFFVVLFFMTFLLKSQSEDTITIKKNEPKKPILCEIKLHDGSVYHGFIDKQVDSLLYVKSSLGVVTLIPKKQVASIDFINGHTTKDSLGTLFIQLPLISNNYYVASSNAFMQRRGEFYGSSSYFLFYNLNYAIEKHFSLGISMSAFAAPLVLHAKSNFQLSQKLFLGIEGFGGSGSWASPKSYGGGGFAKLTYGTAQKNFTVSGGYGDVEFFTMPHRRRRGPSTAGKLEHINSVLAAAAFIYPLSHRFAFTAEAFAAPMKGFYTLAPAIRTTRKPNISWVFGIEGFLTINSKNTAKITGFPYVGFSFKIK